MRRFQLRLGQMCYCKNNITSPKNSNGFLLSVESQYGVRVIVTIGQQWMCGAETL